MKGNKAVIKALNGLLAYEMTAADQYLLHARMYEDMGLHRLRERIQHEHEEELDHARRLIDRILFLEGSPDLSARKSMSVSRDVPEMLRFDLDMERTVAEDIRHIIALCEAEKDYVTRALLRELLSDTEEDHMWWLETQLGLIDKIGLPNYLQSQMGAPA